MGRKVQSRKRVLYLAVASLGLESTGFRSRPGFCSGGVWLSHTGSLTRKCERVVQSVSSGSFAASLPSYRSFFGLLFSLGFSFISLV
jgi:hypothetical protein